MPQPALSAQPLSERGAAEADNNAHPHVDAAQSLQSEVTHLRRALQTRATIDQACGMLMATFRLSPQMAWSVLVTTSQNTNTKLSRLAGDLVGTAQGDPLPEAVKKQMARAARKANGR